MKPFKDMPMSKKTMNLEKSLHVPLLFVLGVFGPTHSPSYNGFKLQDPNGHRHILDPKLEVFFFFLLGQTFLLDKTVKHYKEIRCLN